MSEENDGFSFQDKRRVDPETGQPRESAPQEQPDASQPEPEAADAASAPAEGQEQGSEVPDDVSGLEDLPPAPEEADPSDPTAVLAAERLADLQRINAEYASFRNRAAREQENARVAGIREVVEALIPVLDEVRLAKENDDLTGPFAAHAAKLYDALGKLGVEQYGEPGEAFDPAIHEALMQQTSDEVEVSQISILMQPGYRIGDRIVRAARVGVISPEDE